MARSKFPGKPSKHVNRTRVNVLPSPSGSTTLGDSRLVISIETGAESKQVDTIIQTITHKIPQANVKRRIVRRKRSSKAIMDRRTRSKNNGMSSTSKTPKKNKIPGLNSANKVARKSVHGFATIRKLTKTKHLISAVQKESNNLVGKFVLPSRSVHSSRVIKPNKRFINVEPISIEVRTFKKRVVNKKSSALKSDENSKPAKSKCLTETETNNSYVQDDCGSPVREIAETTLSRTPCSNGRVVLRQARLQLHSHTPRGPEGPFSSTASNFGSPPGTVTCGVCGAVRFYRFVKQARKFNIYSCESCRKFISKMIKRQTCAKNINIPTLVCHKGQGMCHVPPIVRSQHWKLIRCAYRARCPACWLKMCLRSFQMPLALKNSLIRLLPQNMQSADNLFNNSLPLLTWQQSLDKKSINNSTGRVVYDLSVESKELPLRQRSTRLSANKKVEKPISANFISDVKRQKIDLKGPRVKHVCRSASIVLGQPIATFPTDGDKKENMDSAEPHNIISKAVDNKTESENLESNSDSTSDITNDKIDVKIAPNNINEIKLVAQDNKTFAAVRKDKNGKNILSSVSAESMKSQTFAKKSTCETRNTISIDFWESYDPEEVCRSGFGLISSEPFPMEAICFLCGSAGKESFLYCSLCCEPYHPYCLEQSPPDISATQSHSWLCPRCTTCSACGQPDRQKINCQKCNNAYHPECFNNKWQMDDRPTVCSNCFRCKSCGTDDVTKFVGNLPLCSMCFKLRKKGNFCPLCQRCYDDNDFDTKMMECGKCNKWVHAKCEGLSDEQYQILSLLPESIEFLCKLCSSQTTPYWRKAVDTELRARFKNVVRLLSKNRTARNMLKWSPLNSSSPNTKSINIARKLQFSSENDVADNLDYSDFNFDINLTQTILNKDIAPELELLERNECQARSKVPCTPSMVDIKNKLNSNEYCSLKEFNSGMEKALDSTQSEELLKIYRSVLKKVFPWYDPNLTNEENLSKSACDTFRLDMSATERIQTKTVLCENSRVIHQNQKQDSRVCILCKGIGDAESEKEGRLLYCGQNEWVHANCALWSSEVYEEIDGSLQNVHSAVSRGRSIRCAHCKQKGASIGCCAKGCYETYHFACAQAAFCHFMHDKTVYCPSHDLPSNSNPILLSRDFDICRSVYVELDRKKKKYSEPEKVHFMLGSLSVSSLGKIIPVLSDSAEAIIPSGFVCSRLFWSSVEPWKLVPYVITTSVRNAQISNILVDKNFTVDHSLPKSVVEKKLKEILSWQRDSGKDKSEMVEFEDEEEPQNGADLLSPELTDAILEEIPHDLLDGISMQDIFPKFMSYEELLNMDFKASDISSNNENLKNEGNFLSCEQKQRKSDGDHIKDITDIDIQENCNELKRSKSEVFPHLGGVDKFTKARSQQRSCSLTWSCKLDSSLSPAIKKRKVVPRENNMYLQLLQVDGACDSSSSSECSSPPPETEDLWSPQLSDQPVQCERCQCTYRTQASFKRHLETCEVMSTSESDSEITQEECVRDQNNSANVISNPVSSDVNKLENVPVVVNVNESTEPYVVTSYETYSTYQATQNDVQSTVLNSSTFVTSESLSEVVSLPESTGIYYPSLQQQVLEQKPVSSVFTQQDISINQSPASINDTPQVSIIEAPAVAIDQTASLPVNQPTSYCINPSNPLCINQPSAISIDQSGQFAINQTVPISLNQPGTTIPINTPVQPVEIQSQPITIQPVSFPQEVTPVFNIAPQNQITIDAKMLTASCPNVLNSVVTQTLNLPQNQFVKPTIKPTVVSQKTIRGRGRPRSLAAKRTQIPRNGSFIIPQSNSVGASMIMQPLPSSNLMPAFVDAFQQHTGQNLQYVATITPQITSTLSTQPQIIQIQPENNFVSLVQGVQPTMIIQQPRVVTDQLILDSSGSVVWATQPVQPVYYGFETIVQNTVMQSQQFLPTTVPGVLTANSSYSTTTQVFQTSKLEPVLDVASGSFVLLNSGIVNPQPVQVTQVPPTVSSNLQSQLPAPPSSVQSKCNNWTPVETTMISKVPSPNPKPATVADYTPNNSTGNSITLPVSPFIPEHGIPTNIVTPTPKVPTSIQCRPMSRVLPMQTTAAREPKKAATVSEKHSFPLKENKVLVEPKKLPHTTNSSPKITILEDIIIKQDSETLDKTVNENLLKIVFQKQNQEGVYKISNGFIAKNTSSAQVAPLKPIKPKTAPILNKIEHTLEKSEKDDSLKNVTKITNILTEPKISQEKVESGNNPSILYTVETLDGFRYSSTSIDQLWTKVFEAVQAARAMHNMAPLPSDALNMINNLQLLGLKSNSLRYLLEQLPGAGKCNKYKPTFYMPATQLDLDEFLIGHENGAIRCAKYTARNEPNDMFGWLASKHRKPESSLIDCELLPRRGSVTNLPMAMRFRQLKLTSKISVGVYRSSIHRRGLFCLRDIECGEMVIEYSGEVIRSILTDKREKYYNSKGIGCYMFRIDDNLVVDATIKGNAARFINHSCDPNCYSKVVEILGHKHIIIFALRRILCGEELTYDYKFPFEEDKIPCTCGARRCRKFLN